MVPRSPSILALSPPLVSSKPFFILFSVLSLVGKKKTKKKIFKRLEFRIIGLDDDDFPFVDTLAEGVGAFQAVLRAQDEASGVQLVTPVVSLSSFII